jgi:two-component system cell cycle sensor histidine kinase/response regulator CckA
VTPVDEPRPSFRHLRHSLTDALTRPSRAVRDTERRGRARIMAGLLVGCGPAILAERLVRLALDAPPLPPAIAATVAATVAAGLIAYLLSRTRWFEWGAVILTLAGTVGPCAIAAQETDPPAVVVALTLATLGVAFASLLFPFTAALLSGAATLLGISVVALTHPSLTATTRPLAPVAATFLEVFVLSTSAVARRSLRLAAAQDRQLRELVEQAPFGVAALHDGRIGFANRALLATLGSPPLEWVLGVRFADRLLPEDRGAFESAGATPVTVRLPVDGATSRLLEITRIDDATFDDRPADLLVTRDITDEREVTEHLLLMERLASLGTLAASVGHEINNPLTFVLFNLDFLREELRELLAGAGDPRRASEALEIVADTRDGARRASEIVTELKAFGGSTDEATDIDVEAVLRSALRIAGTELRHRARVVEHLASVARVRGSVARLGQVLLNLLVNAAQAIPRGAADRNQVTVGTSMGPDDTVVITVTDTGCGIPEEHQRRIFEPFFTTKPAGQGTGLGLAICAKLVREMGGTLDFESQVGLGTTFRLRLPAATGTAADRNPSEQAPSRSGTGRVLVVDDERPVTDALRRLLRGYAVTVAGGGEEALELCRRQRFDAIVCDLVMTRGPGWELYERLRAERRGQEERMVFVTAGAAIPAARSFLASVDNPVLEKPFDPAALRRIVGELCRRPSEGATS